MGKPYALELGSLDRTYSDALRESPDEIAEAIASCAHLPMLAVGSGGSLTTAHFASQLHEAFAGKMAKAVTPLDIGDRDPLVAKCGVMFFSAGGKNRDIVTAFKRAKVAEARRLFVLCGKKKSPLFRLAEETPEASGNLFRIPGGRDGFLATNSLVASCVRLFRGYNTAFGVEIGLPDSLDALMASNADGDWRSLLREASAGLWRREYLLTLHGSSTRPGAADIESRFHEAALGPVQVADFRNFGHGRHHWLAKLGERTGILAFTTPSEELVAKSTLSLIPRGVPVTVLRTSQVGPSAALVSIIWSIFIASGAGQTRGIDPGRPGVPAFGRKIYNLSSQRPRFSQKDRMQAVAAIAVERKLGLGCVAMTYGRTSVGLLASCEAFRARLAETTFGAVVADFDGTLCDRSERGRRLRPTVARELERLLRAGIVLGVATGRGQSVRQELCRSLPKALWPRILVGYYNGSDVGTLNNPSKPDRTDATEGDLAKVASALAHDERIARTCTVTRRRHQLTLEPKALSIAETWAEVNDVVIRVGVSGVTVLQSAHSVDVVSAAASKRRVVEEVGRLMRSADLAVLCLGDRGRWPGNDYEMLASQYSLSVDEVSTDPLSCWNLAPAGVRGVEAALFYLKALRARSGRARIAL